MQHPERHHRPRPKGDRVDREDLVEGSFAGVQGLDRSENEPQTALLYRSPIAPRRLTQHGLRVIDAHDGAVTDPPAGFGERHPGAETDLQDPIARSEVEQRDGPQAPLDVRTAAGHDGAGEPTEHAPWAAELRHDYGTQTRLPTGLIVAPAATALPGRVAVHLFSTHRSSDRARHRRPHNPSIATARRCCATRDG